MNNFEKKQWLRLILCAMVLIAVSLFLTGIIGGEHMTYSLTEKADAPAVNGTAVEEAEQGFGGTVTVKATLDGSTVQALTVETPDETPGLGQRASEEDFTSQFIGKEGPFTFGENGIDALSGATVTSNAVLKALNRAITGEDAAEPAEEPKAEVKEEPGKETTEEPAPAAAEEPKTEESAAEPETAGTAVEETVQGFGGEVTVKATLDGKTVKTLSIDTPNETPGLGQKASEEAFTSQFIGKEGPVTYGENGVEAITGATVTSNAVLEGLNKAFPAETVAEPAAEEPAAEEKAAEPAAGTEIEKSEQGFGGEVTVKATLDGTTVKALSIDTPNETPGLGQKASEEAFTSQFIGQEGPFTYGENGVEAITGATVTSNAVLKALNQAFPGAEPAAEEKKEEAKPAAEAETAKKETAQVPASVISKVAVTMGQNSENNIVTSYLEQDPYLKNIYEGYGFAKDYGSARGHTYTLEDVSKTLRPHPKANCITCKTDDFARLVNTEGIEVYSKAFDEVMPLMKNTISCYNCHGDGMGMDGQLAVSHSYVKTALGDAAAEIPAAILSCGQCHIEYYFTPSDSETMMPYHSKAEMTPEAILAYYDAMGFYDWEQPGTGTKLLKAQHPEMETVLAGKHAANFGMTCADCHMPQETTDDGIEYRSHYFVSPLANEILLNSCTKCHGTAENLIALVQNVQGKVTARETEVGNKLSALKDKLTAAAADGKLGAEQLDAVRKLHREAQWFFDFCYVENSEGAHNSALSLSCLDTSEAKIDEAMVLLGERQDV